MRVTLDFPAAEEILREVGLDEQGDTQMFHTKNVLRRIQKYMPYRTGATIKLTVAQTDPACRRSSPKSRRWFICITA